MVLFEFLSECLILVPLRAHTHFHARSPARVSLLRGSVQSPGWQWCSENPNSTQPLAAEAFPSQCSCYSSCCCSCSGLKLLAVGAGSLFHSLKTEMLFLGTGHSLCFDVPDSRLLFKALLCVLPPLLPSACTQGWCPATPQAPKQHSPCWCCSDSQHWNLSLHRSQGFILHLILSAYPVSQQEHPQS